MRYRCLTFQEWCMSQYDEFKNLNSKHIQWVKDSEDKVIHMLIYHTKKNKQGRVTFKKSTLLNLTEYTPYDGWDTEIMIGLAWADYKGETIPAKLCRKSVPIESLSYGDTFYAVSGEKFVMVGKHPTCEDMYISAIADPSKDFSAMRMRSYKKGVMIDVDM